MNIRTIFLLLLFSLEINSSAFDHSLPYKSVKGLNSGHVVTAEELESHFEVVNQGQNLKINIYNKEMKLQDVGLYTITAKTELTPAKKQEDLLLTSKGKYFEASFNSKGVKKYDLYLTVKNNKNSKEDLLKFTIKNSRVKGPK